MIDPNPIESEFATSQNAPAYEAWFRAKVERAMTSDRPSIPHAEVGNDASYSRQTQATLNAAARLDGRGDVAAFLVMDLPLSELPRAVRRSEVAMRPDPISAQAMRATRDWTRCRSVATTERTGPGDGGRRNCRPC